MKISLQNFRSFRSAADVEIRPLTLVVGQNSTGKTSFLAALRYMLSFRDRSDPNSLNSPPFDLGSFEAIAHHTDGKGPKRFTIGLQKTVDVSKYPSMYALSKVGNTTEEIRDLSVNLHFVDVFGSAEVGTIEFHVGEYKLLLHLYPEANVVLFSGREMILEGDKRRLLPFERFVRGEAGLNVSAVIHLISNAFYAWQSASAPNRERRRFLDDIMAAFEALLRSMPNHVYASAPVRSTPERVYSASEATTKPDGSSAPYRLRRLKTADRKRWQQMRRSLNDFGKTSGLYSNLDVARLTPEAGGPFQIRLEVNKHRSSIADVGYGVSQALPVATEILEAPPRSAFLLQQPEVHLHPKAQAGLASFLVEHLSKDKEALIIAETHSDYILDRVRIDVLEKKILPAAVSILFFENVGSRTEIHQIAIGRNGEVLNPPECFREFFIREQSRLLGL